MADQDPVVFDERGAKLLDAARKVVAGMNRNPQGRPPDSFRISSGKWISFINAANEAVPPYACMRVTDASYDDEGNIVSLTCNKPSTTFATNYVFNGSQQVPALSEGSTQAAGLCTYGPWTIVACSTVSGAAPSTGEYAGPVPDSWTISKGYPAVAEICGTADSDNGWKVARLRQITALVGKTDASIAAISTNTPGSGSVSIYALVSSTLTDTNQNVTAYNMTATAVSSGVFVQLKYIDGVPWVDVESCP